MKWYKIVQVNYQQQIKSFTFTIFLPKACAMIRCADVSGSRILFSRNVSSQCIIRWLAKTCLWQWCSSLGPVFPVINTNYCKFSIKPPSPIPGTAVQTCVMCGIYEYKYQLFFNKANIITYNSVKTCCLWFENLKCNHKFVCSSHCLNNVNMVMHTCINKTNGSLESLFSRLSCFISIPRVTGWKQKE